MSLGVKKVKNGLCISPTPLFSLPPSPAPSLVSLGCLGPLISPHLGYFMSVQYHRVAIRSQKSEVGRRQDWVSGVTEIFRLEGPSIQSEMKSDEAGHGQIKEKRTIFLSHKKGLRWS